MSKKTVSSKKIKVVKSSPKTSVAMPSGKKVPLSVLKKRGKKIYARWYKKMNSPKPQADDSNSYHPIFLETNNFPVGRFPLEGDWITNLKENLDKQGINNGAFGIVRAVSFGLNPRQEISLRLEVMTGENQFEIFEFDYAKAESFIKANKINDLESIRKQPCLVCKMFDSRIVRMLSL